MEKLIKNTIIETYCLRHCCKDTPKRAVHAEGGALSINTEVKSEDTEIPDTRNHRHTDGVTRAEIAAESVRYCYRRPRQDVGRGYECSISF